VGPLPKRWRVDPRDLGEDRRGDTSGDTSDDLCAGVVEKKEVAALLAGRTQTKGRPGAALRHAHVRTQRLASRTAACTSPANWWSASATEPPSSPRPCFASVPRFPPRSLSRELLKSNNSLATYKRQTVVCCLY